MTEQLWLTHWYKPDLLAYLAESRHDRKLRLFACACLRRITRFVNSSQVETAIGSAEQATCRRARQ